VLEREPAHFGDSDRLSEEEWRVKKKGPTVQPEKGERVRGIAFPAEGDSKEPPPFSKRDLACRQVKKAGIWKKKEDRPKHRGERWPGSVRGKRQNLREEGTKKKKLWDRRGKEAPNVLRGSELTSVGKPHNIISSTGLTRFQKKKGGIS